MIRHIVLWTLNDGTLEEKEAIKLKIKKDIEALKDIIPGIVSLQVITEPMAETSGDIVLDSVLENEEALANYQIHEEHQKVVTYIRSVVKNRICIDYHEM